MDIRHISPTYAVSPQVTADDMARVAEAGFTTVICNRPNTEVGPDQQEAAIKAAAELAGLAFVSNPVTHAALTEEIVSRQKAICDASPGPTFAYCASGTRSSIVWALGQAAEKSSDDILQSLRNGGYMLDQLRPQLDALRQES